MVREPSAGAEEDSDRLLLLYIRLLAPLIGGYLLFDRAFAYLHLPGLPLYVGEMVLGVGALGALASTGYLRVPLRDEPILALLAAFVLWGLARTLPGVRTYGMDAIRDSALWYYCLFAFFVIAALARSPVILERLVAQLSRLLPWLLVWLPVAVLLIPIAKSAPNVPFTTVSVLSHKAGNAAVAALLALGWMWLLPGIREPRARAFWSVMALVVIGLSATQNRGGLLGVALGGMVGLSFVRDRLGLMARAVLVVALGLSLASLLSLKIPFPGLQGREFSASQLIANVVSFGGEKVGGNLNGTVRGRQELWTRVVDKQITDGRLVEGAGFGPNLAASVGVYDEGKDTLRSPHNSHLDVMARMGLVGVGIWVALWGTWYWRLVGGCRRLAREGLHLRRQVAVLCLTVNTAILVSSFFDPQLEGPQVAAILWTTFGVGIAVTTARPWFVDHGSTLAFGTESRVRER